jgi:hypothetical protein
MKILKRIFNVVNTLKIKLEGGSIPNYTRVGIHNR